MGLSPFLPEGRGTSRAGGSARHHWGGDSGKKQEYVHIGLSFYFQLWFGVYQNTLSIIILQKKESQDEGRIKVERADETQLSYPLRVAVGCSGRP